MAHSFEGLGDSMRSLSLNGNTRELGEELRRVEHQYLRPQLTGDERKKPELVSWITEKFILQKLEGLFSDVTYTGSNYEYSTVPGKSDYDIQFCLKLPFTRQNHQRVYSTTVEECGDPAWRIVKGGPDNLQNSSGYLSTAKARRLIQSEIDKALQSVGSSLKFAEDAVKIKRSTSGPATTLNVEWRSISLSIDIVVCLKSEDIGDRYGDRYDHDLVGKPYTDGFDSRDSMWRLSYSREEKEELRSFHRDDEKKVLRITLLRIMKVIKRYQPQLNSFPSYFYKNILFKLDEEKPHVSWDRASLPERTVRLSYKFYDNKSGKKHYGVCC